MLIRTRKNDLTFAERLALAERDAKLSSSRGALPWYPMCAKCNAPVRAYGREEFKSYYEVWAECGHGDKRIRERKKVRIKKPRENMKDFPDPNWLKNKIRMLVFFG